MKAASEKPSKASVRAAAHARRDALSPEIRAIASDLIALRAIDIMAAVRPRSVAAYGAIRSEVDPSRIVAAAAAAGIRVGLPAVEDDVTITFRQYRPGDALVAGPFGTLAPSPSAPQVDPELMVVPLVAFDRTGMRLGHGRGFYDRAIGRLRAAGAGPRLLGIAFAVQEVAAIPSESHDVRMDWIVTENETLDFRGIG